LGGEGHVVDITDSAAVRHIIGGLGAIDVLINNAGLERITPVDDGSPEMEALFRRIVEINIVGTYLVTRAAAPQMPNGAAIINTASLWSRSSEAGFSAYVASKHATIGLTKTWAKELGSRSIRVNAVCPGWVKTEASMLSLQRMAERSGRPEQDLLQDITEAQILPGLMQPDDVAGPYLFLASDLAANITGQSLGIDRGELPW
jgi:NAD(P)-dependent dehydrogenase (short-subunit alcohol dehydrogenase family)